MDSALLQRWIDHRDAEAFRELAMKYLPMVYATCMRILGDPSEAEDVAQECFEALARLQNNNFPHLGPWLHRVATNKSLNAARSRSRRMQLERHVPALDPVYPAIADKDTYAVVDEVIAQLPDELRIPLVTYFFDNQTHDAIASTLGVTRSAISHRISRAIEHVREDLHRRGFNGSVTLVGGVLEGISNSTLPVPATLAATISKIAIAGAPMIAFTAAPITLLAKGGLLMTASQKIAATVAAVALLGTVGVYTMTRDHEMPAPSDASKTEQAAQHRDTERKSQASQPPAQMVRLQAMPTTTKAAPIFAGATLSGIVVDPQDRPNEGVTVHLRRAGVPEDRPTALTDEHGGFSFQNLVDAEYSLYLQMPGYRRPEFEPRAKVAIANGEDVSGVKVVSGDFGMVIAGTVVDAQGMPIPGARVTAQSLPSALQSFTNEMGEYRLRGLEDTGYTLVARRSGKMSSMKQALAGAEDIDFVLEDAQTIRGQVVVKGTAKAPANTELTIKPATMSASEFIYEGMIPESDGGRFEVTAEVEGKWLVEARAKGFAPVSVRVDVTAGIAPDEVRLELEGGGRVDGIVKSASGEPVPGASIYQSVVPREGLREVGVLATTDSDGLFSLESTALEAQTLAAYHEQFGEGKTSLLPESTRAAQIEIVLGGLGSLSGTVTVGGAPLVEGRVVVMNKKRSVALDQQGRFRVDNVPQGEHTLQVYMSTPVPPLIPTIFTQMVSVNAEQETKLTIALPVESGSIAGHVDTGGPEAGIVNLNAIVETGEGSVRYSMVSVRADGTFEIPKVFPGAVTLNATLNQVAKSSLSQRRRIWFDLSENERVEQLISFASGSSVICQLEGDLGEQAVAWIELYKGDVVYDPENRRALAGLAAARAPLSPTGDTQVHGIEPGIYTAVVHCDKKYMQQVIEISEATDTNVSFAIP